MVRIPFLKREKEKTFLVLDIGTEAIKALFLKKFKEKNVILKTSLEYFEQFGVFDSWDFERDVLEKTISKTLENLSFQKEKNSLPVILGLPANILKGRVVSQSSKREKPEIKINQKEEREILEKVFKEAKKRISPNDFQFINFQILETKIEGYKVDFLSGYKGKNLDFRNLATFLPKFYLENIKNIFLKFGLKIEKLVHSVEGLISLSREITEGIFLDIGGEVTQIFLVKEGKLKGIDEFEIGGRIFSQSLSERFGLKEREAQIFKERYSRKELSKESFDRVREIFDFPLQTWFKNLKSKLKELNGKELLPSNFFLFGGGSLLPEIVEILENGNWEDFVFSSKFETKLIYPKDLKNVEFETFILNNSQIIPTILLAYAK